MPTVTVIIPVYKVERYLDACVESVVRQSYADLEILLVDDGSPDRCPALCDAWAEKDPRIKVIHRENGGLSAARNSGIDAARGEFLLFVDSDDLLEPDAVRRAVDAQRQQDADLVIFNLTYVDEANRPLPQPDFSGFTDEILDEDGVWQRCFALAETRIYYVVAWNKLYRRSLFQHLRYAPGKRYEDQFLLPSTGDGSVTQKYFHLPDHVCAPVQQGDVVGTVELKLAGETIGVVDLIAGQDVSRNPLLFTVARFQEFLGSLYLKVVITLSIISIIIYFAWVLLNNWNRRKPTRKIRRR